MNQALQLDPLTMDRYNYVNGDPVNLVDFNGHRPCADDMCSGRQIDASSNDTASSGGYSSSGSSGSGGGTKAASQPTCRMMPAGRAGMVKVCSGGSQGDSGLNGPLWALAGFGVGLIWDTGGDIVGGIKEVVTHPKETIEGVANLVQAINDCAKCVLAQGLLAAGNGIGHLHDLLTSGSDFDKARTAGHITGTIVTLGLGPGAAVKGVEALGKIGEAADFFRGLRALRATEELPRGVELTAPEGKTVALANGQRTLSGWGAAPEGYVRATPEQVMDLQNQIGYPVRRAGAFDQGTPGKYFASHAERQQAVLNPGAPIQVTSPMCSDCIGFFNQLADATGVPQIVGDPEATRIFMPWLPDEELAG